MDQLEEIKKAIEELKQLQAKGGKDFKNYFAPGSMNIENIEKVENLFPGNADLLKAIKEAVNADANPEIIQELKNCFYGDEAEAESFLDAIKGMKDVAITELVRQKVKDKIIPVEAAGRRLWTILSKNGLYQRTISNWNKAIK